MKMIALLGSPKKELGVTFQYLKFAQKSLPNSTLDIEFIGAEIPALEKHPELFGQVVEKVKNADAVLWAFPVFVMQIPGQLLRFIELAQKSGAQKIFAGKYATAFSTSVHFHDHLPHHYLQALSEDWGMSYFDGYSADMDDLTNPHERNHFRLFLKDFEDTVDQRRALARRFAPLPTYEGRFEANGARERQAQTKKSGKRIVVATDATDQDRSLMNMIDLFRASSENETEVIDINSIKIIGGCRECYACTEKGRCSMSDDVESVYREKLMTAAACIFAPRTVGRFVSARFKEFTDRRFFDGHRKFPEGIQAGFLLSAPLRVLPEYRDWCEISAQHACNSSLMQIATDEDAQGEIEAHVREMARRIDRAIATNAAKPMLFPGVGGHKVLRDLVYTAKFIFREDYRYYKKRGMLDYPQNHIGRNIMTTFLYYLMGVPGVRKTFERHMGQGMIAAHRKALDRP